MFKNCNNPRFKRTHLSCLRESKVKASGKNCVLQLRLKKYSIYEQFVVNESFLWPQRLRDYLETCCVNQKKNSDYFLFQRVRNISKDELNVSIQLRLIGKAAFVSQHSRFSIICGVRTTSFLSLDDDFGSCSSDQESLQQANTKELFTP